MLIKTKSWWGLVDGCEGEVEGEVEGGEMLICRFYTQPVSTQAGADGDDKGGDKNINCDNVFKDSDNGSSLPMNEATICDFRAIG